VEGRFCRGFRDFHSVFAWFFVVSLWWLDGGIVVVDAGFFGSKNFSSI
jgi:hypothetical protein